MLVASVLSTNAFLGETGFSYATQGGAYILWPAIWVAGYVYGALFFGRYLRRSRALTVAEFFGHRFDSKSVQAAAGVTIVLGLGGYLLAVTQGTAVIPWQSSRYLMAKTEHVVIRSACIAAIVVAVSNLALYAAGTAVNLSKTDIFPHEETMIWAAMNMMPPVVGALLLAGVMAAALSSATTFLSLVGFSVSNDVLSGNKDDDQAMLRFSRLVMLLVGAVALMISFFMPPNLFWLTYYVGTAFASSWGPVAFMSIWSDTITSRAAYWGIISGFADNVIPRFLDSMGWIELPSQPEDLNDFETGPIYPAHE